VRKRNYTTRLLRFSGALLLALIAAIAAACGSSRAGPDPIIKVPPAEVGRIGAYRAPDNDPQAPTVRIRFLVATLDTLGELRSLRLDPDGDGPLPAEELEFAAFDLSLEPVQITPVGRYNGWICDREFPIGEDLPVVFYLECEFGSTSATVSSLAFSHDRPPWPY